MVVLGHFDRRQGFDHCPIRYILHSIEALELQGSGIVPLEQLVHHSMFNLTTSSFPVEGNRHMRYSIPVLGTFAVNRWSRYYPRQSVCQYKRTVYARQSSVDR